jgi:hypothetical protein
VGDVPFESWGLPLPFGELEGIYFTLPVFFIFFFGWLSSFSQQWI